MIPRNFSRRLILAFFLTFITLVSAHQTKRTFAAPPAGSKIYCAANGPVAYFSNILDAPKPSSRSTILPLELVFRNYLVEEYDDFPTNGSSPSFCRRFETQSEAEASKRQLMSQAQQAGKRIVELNWNPGPLVETPQVNDTVAIGPKGPLPTHTICAVGHDDTNYFSAVFDTNNWDPKREWSDGFNGFLKNKFGFDPQIDATCTTMNTVREANQLLKSRVTGLRVNNHKAVETGWRYNASLVAVNPAPQAIRTPTPKVDDDPEPAPRPAPTSAPTLSTKDFAAKEGPQVLTYCQKDPLLSKIFDCHLVQRSVYNYRMEHGTSDSLASLFTQEKMNLAEAIGTGLNLWVRARATADKFDNRVSNCIEQKFNVAFYAKPYVSKMNEIYAASVAACKP